MTKIDLVKLLRQVRYNNNENCGLPKALQDIERLIIDGIITTKDGLNWEVAKKHYIPASHEWI